MTEENIELIQLQAMLDATDKIFKALSDGYNYASLGLNFGEESKFKEKDYLIWDIHLSRTDEEYIEYINESKTKILNIESRIRENLFWSLEHLKTFNVIPEVFNNEFRYEFLDKLLYEIAERLNNVIGNWNAECCEYDIYVGERRVLVITDKTTIIILDVWNDIH